MRKVSKSRTEDDVISSTNGSILNEDQANIDQEIEPDMHSDAEANESNSLNDNVSDVSKETPKKGKAKTKGKKKKVEKSKAPVEQEYEVEKIVGSKKIRGKLHYLIRWKGYSADSDTWEPENTLSCPNLIEKYNEEEEDSEAKSARAGSKRKGKKATKPVSAKKTKTQWNSKDDDNAEYEVDRILEVHHKKNGSREFLIHWKGWSSKFDSWEPESNLNCSELIKKFMDKVSVARSSDSRSLRVAPETTSRFTLQDPSSGRRLSKRRGQSQRIRYDNAE